MEFAAVVVAAVAERTPREGRMLLALLRTCGGRRVIWRAMRRIITWIYRKAKGKVTKACPTALCDWVCGSRLAGLFRIPRFTFLFSPLLLFSDWVNIFQLDKSAKNLVGIRNKTTISGLNF